MNKFIHISEYMEEIFPDEKTARQASEIVGGILEARSPRLSDIAAHMPGSEAAAYKRIQRFVATQEPRETLKRLFNEEVYKRRFCAKRTFA